MSDQAEVSQQDIDDFEDSQEYRESVPQEENKFEMQDVTQSEQNFVGGPAQTKETKNPSHLPFKTYLKTYNTDIELLILNRHLGYLSLILITIIVSYFIVFVFIIHQLHVEKKNVLGTALTTPIGMSYSSDGAIWDLAQKISASSSSTTLTYPTRVRITKNQKINDCASPFLPCSKDNDCDPEAFPNFNINKKCLDLPGDRKGCQISSWCPEQDIYDEDTTQIVDLLGVKSQMMIIKPSFSFPDAPDQIYVNKYINETILYPKGGDDANAYMIGNVLVLAGVDYEEIQHTGCVIQVAVVWVCDLDGDSCKTHFEATRIDEDVGYSHKFADYKYDSDGNMERDLYHYSGIKILAQVYGTSEKISFGHIFLYFFMTIGFLFASAMFTDFFMLNISREKKHYKENKYQAIE